MLKILILIPTYNAENDIDKLITGLKYQDLTIDQMMEINVIDSSSTDRTVEILQTKHPDVKIKIIPKSHFNHGETRNELARQSSGDYLLYLTQDVIPYDKQLIKNLLKPFQFDQKIAISYARQLPKPDADEIETVFRSFNYPETSTIRDLSSIKDNGIKTFFNSNACSMYKKQSFVKLGGFPKTATNEDMLFASKAILNGYKVSYTAEAKVYHSHNHTLNQTFKRYFDIGRFFKENDYLLKYASNEKEGLKLIMQQLKILSANRKFHLVPNVFINSVVKLAAYKLGFNNKQLPALFSQIQK